MDPCRMWDSGFGTRQGGLAEGHSSSQGLTPSAVCCPVSRARPPPSCRCPRASCSSCWPPLPCLLLSDTSGHRREGEGTAAHLQHIWAVPLCPGLPASLPPAICASHKPPKPRGAGGRNGTVGKCRPCWLCGQHWAPEGRTRLGPEPQACPHGATRWPVSQTGGLPADPFLGPPPLTPQKEGLRGAPSV